jgi:flavin-dependent dehydrogenase
MSTLSPVSRASTDFDAIVVGARCAGAATAMLLARAGHRVLLVDRARFPSEIPQGHFIHRHGPPRLARWGLLERIVATGCPPVTSMMSHLGDFPLVVHDLERDGVAWGYGPRRAPLDKVLVDAAVAAGAELREGLSVERLLTDGGRVVGVRPAGSAPIRARLTVGADGKHSRVAREVAAPAYETVPTLACWYFTYFRDVPDPRFEMYVLPRRRAIFAHPTSDGLLAVFVGWPIDEFPAVRAALERSFMATLDLAPGLGERVRAGRRAERFFGTGDAPNFLRQSYGPGWALVGDAGCHKDPFLALGICDALRDAELLAEAAGEGLSGERPLEAALAGYARRRDEATLPDYRENLRAAHLGPPPPELARIRAAVRHRPQDATRLVLATQGLIPREDFFNPQNLRRLLGDDQLPEGAAETVRVARSSGHSAQRGPVPAGRTRSGGIPNLIT